MNFKGNVKLSLFLDLPKAKCISGIHATAIIIHDGASAPGKDNAYDYRKHGHIHEMLDVQVLKNTRII